MTAAFDALYAQLPGSARIPEVEAVATIARLQAARHVDVVIEVGLVVEPRQVRDVEAMAPADRRLQQLLLARSGPGRIVDACIAEANGRGGVDNITAIIVQVTGIATTATDG